MRIRAALTFLLLTCGWIDIASGAGCTNAQYFQRVAGVAQQVAQLEYSTVLGQFGGNDERTRYAYLTLMSVMRCPGLDCTADDERVTFTLAGKMYYNNYIQAKKAFDALMSGNPDQPGNLATMKAEMDKNYNLFVGTQKCLSEVSSQPPIEGSSIPHGGGDVTSETSGPGPIEGGST